MTTQDKYANFECGKYYHVYNRAIGSERLFFKDENYRYFLRKYKFHLNSFLETYGYCLMPNHFHFLIKVNEGVEEVHEKLSNQFRKLFIAYAQAINLQQCRMGGLFIKPFKRKQVIGRADFERVINYIHRNPVHHGLCKHPSVHEWNSYAHILDGKPEHYSMNILSPVPFPDINYEKKFERQEEFEKAGIEFDE
jgi:REP element-mobilizing transposase RayT